MQTFMVKDRALRGMIHYQKLRVAFYENALDTKFNSRVLNFVNISFDRVAPLDFSTTKAHQIHFMTWKKLKTRRDAMRLSDLTAYVYSCHAILFLWLS